MADPGPADRRVMVVGTAGHVDHGKSALVKALTGTDPDRLKEEQERGITIDLGFADVRIGDVAVAFVDVPGHERFIHNMLAGATAVDAVLLVVAADEGVKPQTREHFEICRLLGLSRGVVVLSKSDLADQDRLAQAAAAVEQLVAGSFLAGARTVPVSAKTGAGLDALREALVAVAAMPRRAVVSSVVRLAVDRAFAKKGFGTIVTGTLTGGILSMGDELDLLPAGRRARVRGLQMHGRAVECVEAPRRVAINLAGVEPEDVPRGTTLARAGTIAVTRRADVVIEVLAGARPLRHGALVRVHLATTEVGARVAIAGVRERGGTEWRFARPGAAGVEIPGGSEGLCRLRFECAVVAARGDRLILRTPSPADTLGGGRVLDAAPPVKGLRTVAGQTRLAAIAADGADVVAIWLGDAGASGLTIDDLLPRAGFASEALDHEVDRLVRADLAWRVGRHVFAATAVASVEQVIRQALRLFHETQPASDGLPVATLRSAVGPGVAPALFDLALGSLASRGVLAGTDRVSMASHAPLRAQVDGAVLDAVERTLRGARLSPPDEAALSSLVARPADAVARAIEHLARERRIVRLGGLAFHTEALAWLRDDVKARASAGGATGDLDIATFKTRYGLSRKFAIPLLEWLDRSHVTRRAGARRVVL